MCGAGAVHVWSRYRSCVEQVQVMCGAGSADHAWRCEYCHVLTMGGVAAVGGGGDGREGLLMDLTTLGCRQQGATLRGKMGGTR